MAGIMLIAAGILLLTASTAGIIAAMRILGRKKQEIRDEFRKICI